MNRCKQQSTTESFIFSMSVFIKEYIFGILQDLFMESVQWIPEGMIALLNRKAGQRKMSPQSRVASSFGPLHRPSTKIHESLPGCFFLCKPAERSTDVAYFCKPWIQMMSMFPTKNMLHDNRSRSSDVIRGPYQGAGWGGGWGQQTRLFESRRQLRL